MQDELVIEPGRSFQNYWRDLWRYRELFYILAWRDILVRYKQTVIGIAWALIRPFITMLSSRLSSARLPSSGAGFGAVSAAGIRRHAAVAVFFDRAQRVEQ